MPPDQIIGASLGVPPAWITTDEASAFNSALMPICARSCCMACAMRGFGSVLME
jgi:hypothetical protein